jgi:hypothetical protein
MAKRKGPDAIALTQRRERIGSETGNDGPADQRDQQDEQIERDPQADRADAGQHIERVKLHRQVGQEENAEHRQK